MTEIAVIIVNWNAREDLKKCLLSFTIKPQPKVSYTIWVVDNASSDGSAAMVRSEFPDVKLLANKENVGFSKGNNLAIAQSQSRFVFLLNSDAAIFPGALDELVKFADSQPEAGIIGPKVLNPDGTLQFSCRSFPSLMAGFFRNTFLGKIMPNNKYAAKYLMTDFDHSQAMRVDWVSGCAMFIRRDLIKQIGVLDDRFYMYCEDVDICRRTWEAGLAVMFAPQAQVTHAIGKSSDKNAEKMIVEFHRSWFEYDKKWRPTRIFVLRGAVYSGLWLRAAVRILRRRLTAWRQKHSQIQPKEVPNTVVASTAAAIESQDKAAL